MCMYTVQPVLNIIYIANNADMQLYVTYLVN